MQLQGVRQRWPLRLCWAVMGLLAGMLTACASAPAQSASMKTEGVVASSQALRVRLRAEAIPFTGRLEQSLDRIAAGSANAAVKQRALLWKIDAVPALYLTLFNQYPLLALLDTWTLLLQMELYFESPDGKAAFGAGTSDILAVTQEFENQVQAIARWAAPERDFAKVRASLLKWAVQHPIQEGLATRTSLTEHVVSNANDEGLSGFELVGQATADIDGIVARMDFMPVLVPRQASWQTELTYQRLFEPRLGQLLAEGDTVARRLDQISSWLGPGGLDDLANRQRMAILRALDAERLEIQALLREEEVRATDYVSKERSVVLEQLKQERVAATEELRQGVDQATAKATARAKELVTYALLRLALAEIVVVLVLVAGLWLLRRTERRPAAPKHD